MNGFENPAKQIDIEHYFRLIVRQKWFVLAPALVGVVVMGVLSLFMQDLYSAKATILVEQTSLPTEFMKSTLPYGPETYVRSLVEQIKSTSRLEKVIMDFNLYPEMRRKRAIEEVVAFMRERVSIESRANDTFSVSFSGEDPETVQKVTNRLTDMFIEENVKYRLERSSQNVAFLESQAKALRDQVSEKERHIQEFKSLNLERLPEQRQANQLQLSAAQQRLQSVSEALSAATARAASARDRLAMMREFGTEEDPMGLGSTQPSPDSLESRLNAAQQELSALKSQLSDKHPDVKLKQKEVESLQAQYNSRPPSAKPSVRRKTRNPEVLRAIDEERTAQADMVRYQAELARLERSMTEISLRLEETPKVELQINELNKGLTVLREQADGFQKKATDAAASLELERQNQGSQFRALDKARVPSKPDSPNRPLLVALGGGMGTALGLLLILGLDLLFRPFLEEEDLARFTGVPVLVAVPHLGPFPSDWQRFKRQMSQLLNFLLGTIPLSGSDYAATTLKVPQSPTPSPPSPWLPRQSTRLAPKPKGFTYLAGDPLEADEDAPNTVAVQTLGGGGSPPIGKDVPLYAGETGAWTSSAHRYAKKDAVPSPYSTPVANPPGGGYARGLPGQQNLAGPESPLARTEPSEVSLELDPEGEAESQGGSARRISGNISRELLQKATGEAGAAVTPSGSTASPLNRQGSTGQPSPDLASEGPTANGQASAGQASAGQTSNQKSPDAGAAPAARRPLPKDLPHSGLATSPRPRDTSFHESRFSAVQPAGTTAPAGTASARGTRTTGREIAPSLPPVGDVADVAWTDGAWNDASTGVPAAALLEQMNGATQVPPAAQGTESAPLALRLPMTSAGSRGESSFAPFSAAPGTSAQTSGPGTGLDHQPRSLKEAISRGFDAVTSAATPLEEEEANLSARLELSDVDTGWQLPAGIENVDPAELPEDRGDLAIPDTDGILASNLKELSRLEVSRKELLPKEQTSVEDTPVARSPLSAFVFATPSQPVAIRISLAELAQAPSAAPQKPPKGHDGMRLPPSLWQQSNTLRIRPRPLLEVSLLHDESLKELGHRAPWLT